MEDMFLPLVQQRINRRMEPHSTQDQQEIEEDDVAIVLLVVPTPSSLSFHKQRLFARFFIFLALSLHEQSLFVRFFMFLALSEDTSYNPQR